jgi:hypothetical protein
VGPLVAEDPVDAFLAAEFSHGERHVRRLRKVAALETLREWKPPPTHWANAVAKEVLRKG